MSESPQVKQSSFYRVSASKSSSESQSRLEQLYVFLKNSCSDPGRMVVGEVLNVQDLDYRLPSIYFSLGIAAADSDALTQRFHSFQHKLADSIERSGLELDVAAFDLRKILDENIFSDKQNSYFVHSSVELPDLGPAFYDFRFVGTEYISDSPESIEKREDILYKIVRYVPDWHGYVGTFGSDRLDYMLRANSCKLLDGDRRLDHSISDLGDVGTMLKMNGSTTCARLSFVPGKSGDTASKARKFHTLLAHLSGEPENPNYSFSKFDLVKMLRENV